MDGEKFDALLKRMCTTRLTRLDALRGLVAGAAAAVTGASLGSNETKAQKKKKKGGVKAQNKKTKKGGRGGGKPTNPGGNITCAGGLKVDSGQFKAGTCGNVKHSSSGCECTIRWCVSADGKTLSFGPAQGEVSCLVGRVIVKGGPASEDYTFNPPVSSADGLISPELDNGNLPEISHFTFCDIECPPCDPDDCPEKPCQEAYCDAKGKCAYRPIVCPPSDDKCEESYCDPDKGSCKTRPIICPPSNNECEEVYCDPDKGCKTRPIDCDDDDPCTIDTCNPKTGQCEHEPVDCDDDNACTVDTCVPQKDGTYQCKHEPVDCDDDDLCTTDRCNPKTGECEYAEVICDPETLCETCICKAKTGECVCTPIVCNDDDACTADRCDPATGQCIYTPIDCDDDNACTVDSCDPEKGCKHEPVDCDDDIVCTADSCDPDKGCKNIPDDDLCPAKPGCDAVCDPTNPDRDENGCVYTCDTFCGKSTSRGFDIPNEPNSGCVGACRASKTSSISQQACNDSCRDVCDEFCPNLSGETEERECTSEAYCNPDTFSNCELA